MKKNDSERESLHKGSCSAYAYNLPSGPCKIWSGDFLTMQISSSKRNSNFFIPEASSALPRSDLPFSFEVKNNEYYGRRAWHCWCSCIFVRYLLIFHWDLVIMFVLFDGYLLLLPDLLLGDTSSYLYHEI